MEDNINFSKMGDHLNFSKMEDDLRFSKMEDDLIFKKMEANIIILQYIFDIFYAFVYSHKNKKDINPPKTIWRHF
jgi:hypothetical protein